VEDIMITLQKAARATPPLEPEPVGAEESPSYEMLLGDRICVAAIDHFGRFGFDQSMLETSIANDVDVATLSELFGSIEGLRHACDEYVQSSISTAKTEALSSQAFRPRAERD
jgi:hypothetical protein